MGDLVESSNHSIGADTHRLVLLQGCVNSTSMLASMSLSMCKMFPEMYEVVASLLNSELGLSCTHLNDIPVAFTGKLQFQDQNGVVERPRDNLPKVKSAFPHSSTLSKKKRLEKVEEQKRLMEE